MKLRKIEKNNYKLVGEFDSEYCGPPELYTTGYDPYKLHQVIADGTVNKIEELYLGEECVLLVEVRSGTVQGGVVDADTNEEKFDPFFKFWIEVGIKNSEVLPESLSRCCGAIGVEHTISHKVKDIPTVMQQMVATILEMFKEKIGPYREQLIEFIKQNS